MIDVYQSVTDRIIASLEEGTVPWRKPWVGSGPRNVENGRHYSGINVFLLTLAPYGDPRWGTYQAIKRAGGQVRRHEHSTQIVLLKRATKRRDKSAPEVEPDSYFLFRYYSVFNAEQADGLPPAEDLVFDNEPIERAEQIALGYIGPSVTFGGDRAFYSPTTDMVRVPMLDQFTIGRGVLLHAVPRARPFDRARVTTRSPGGHRLRHGPVCEGRACGRDGGGHALRHGGD